SGVVDLTGDEDHSDEDEGTGMGDSTGVSVSLGDVVAWRTLMAGKRKVVIVKVLTSFSIIVNSDTNL
nr:hypothetical protein [Tanacetum cinerariifolium]